MRRSVIIVFGILSIAAVPPALQADVAAHLAGGITAYQSHRLVSAMGEFLNVLKEDPTNSQAHTYLELIAEEIQLDHKSQTRGSRLMILSEASKALDANRMDSRPVDHAILETTQNAQSERQQHWEEMCQTARIQAAIGNLSSAYDLALRVLLDDPTNALALRTISDLQSTTFAVLASSRSLSLVDRKVLRGFDAYAQADYAEAVSQWSGAHQLISALTPEQSADAIQRLRFIDFEKLATAHVEEAKQAERLRENFVEAVTSFQGGNFDDALKRFRSVALANPEYPELAAYLVQTEAEVEKRRTPDLTDASRLQADTAFSQGVQDLAEGRYADAKGNFEKVLILDPSHPKAKSYLQQIDTQKERHTDPAAAQEHYEAGLVDYAAGDLEEANREWHIALRLDPDNPKLIRATTKVERELVYAKELP